MKHNILIAAGLIGLGTSPAFAFTLPAMAPDMAKAVKSVWVDQMAAERASIFETGEAWMSPVKSPKAEAALAQDDAPLAEKPVLAAKPVEATAEAVVPADPDLDLAVKPEETLAKAGPSEAVMQPSSTPAAAAYPPCRRGAGDDHCIQLYERGVRAQLSGWNRSASGAEAGMGGPYEPVDTTLAGELGGPTSLAMNGDGVTDTAAGETADAATDAR
jgi:hypothetical protein